ncbi:hypothetical protein [Vreelandella sp. TE19]
MTFEQTILIALLTVLGGGVASAFVTSILTSRRDQKNYTKKKYEELYGLIAKDSTDFAKWYLGYMAVFEGALPLSQLKNRASTTTMDTKAKVLMLAALYAENLSTEIELYFQIKQALISYINEASKRADKNVASKISLNDFHALRVSFDKEKNNVFEKLVNLSKSL